MNKQTRAEIEKKLNDVEAHLKNEIKDGKIKSILLSELDKFRDFLRLLTE